MARRLIALAVLLAAGCGGGGEQAVTLQVFADPDEIAAYEKLIDAFERRAPGRGIRLVPVDGQDDHQTKLATSFAAGDPPDLFLINYRRFGQFAARGVLEPLGERVPAGGLYRVAVDAFRYDGRLQCLPQNVSTPVVYFNTALFRRAGVPRPRPDWTWDDVRAAARRLDGGDVTGIGFEPSLNRFAPFVWQAGGEVVDDPEKPTRVSLLEPPDREALEFLTGLQHRDAVTLTLAEAEAQSPEERFAAGTLAMLIESRRATTGLRTVEGLEWDVAPLPVHPRRREPAVMLHADAYCLTKASRHKEAATAFVRFALSAEGAAILARTGRTVPSRRSVAESEAFLDPSQPPASAQVFLDQIPAIRRFPTLPGWHEIEARADVVAEEWFFGAEPPEALGLEIDIATGELFEAEP
ncbi:MAG TPA: sugar ABC transporter substrate-binding protein [Solirubrobacteraceae bacterium]|nr:sugar ABC transporter substrate-binding protein [Solirubrobacteraceae bacterium]